MSFLVRLPADQYQADAFVRFVPTGFDIGSARAAAWLAQLAYEDDSDKIDSIAKNWELRRIVSFKPPVSSTLRLVRTRGLVLHGHGTHFVVFAGTDPLVTANWVSDFDFRLDADGIHRGFATALDAAWPEVVTALTQGGPVDKLMFVGHSLGAALAALGAARAVKDLTLEAAGIYTFGMPRTGNASFADQYNSSLGGRTYRLVHGQDIVPTVPPSSLGFRHVGRLLRCDRFTRFEAGALHGEPNDEPEFAAGLLSALQVGMIELLSGSLAPEIRPDLLGQASRLLPPAIGDHLPDRYWRALQALDK